MPSSTRALSRTLRLTTPSTLKPAQPSPESGPSDTRPRFGFRPNRPQFAAGTRMEPPPSLAWAMGTMPAATAAAEPPLDPPVEWPVFQGLAVGPYASGSVVMVRPNSGVFVRPKFTKPSSANIVAR